MQESLRLSGCRTPLYYLCAAQENACLIAKLFAVIYFLLCLIFDEKKNHVNWDYLKMLTQSSS